MHEQPEKQALKKHRTHAPAAHKPKASQVRLSCHWGAGAPAHTQVSSVQRVCGPTPHTTKHGRRMIAGEQWGTHKRRGAMRSHTLNNAGCGRPPPQSAHTLCSDSGLLSGSITVAHTQTEARLQLVTESEHGSAENNACVHPKLSRQKGTGMQGLSLLW